MTVSGVFRILPRHKALTLIKGHHWTSIFLSHQISELSTRHSATSQREFTKPCTHYTVRARKSLLEHWLICTMATSTGMIQYPRAFDSDKTSPQRCYLHSKPLALDRLNSVHIQATVYSTTPPRSFSFNHSLIWSSTHPLCCPEMYAIKQQTQSLA